MSETAPRLLVSVRNSAEALSAIAGGCDILDIKEPNRGSLGMADPAVIAEVIQSVRCEHPDILISAALGEVIDWQLDQSTLLNVSRQFVPGGCDFVKIGCAGLGPGPEWRAAWNHARQTITASMKVPPQWVAVCYADWKEADAPRVRDVVQAALRDNCCGVLLDTQTKSGRWLLDWISVDELHAIADQVHTQGLFLALAGSLTVANIARLKTVPVDIFAVRGAACVQGNRTSEISAAAVRELKQQLMKSS